MQPYTAASVLVLGLAASYASTAQAACPENPSIPEIQGAAHLSPCDGESVTSEGTVTAVASNGFYVQDPAGDGDPATADGIFVFTGTGEDSPTVDVGDGVRLTGEVSEFIPGGADTGNLSTTQFFMPEVEVQSSGGALPEPVVIGEDGRIPPNRIVISDDELPVNLQEETSELDPDKDGIDFYESLEGMRVTVSEPVAVSGTRTFSPFSSEVFTLPDRGRFIAPRDARTNRGGILLQPDLDNRGDQNPERVQIQFDGTLFPGEVPALKVGDRLSDVTGVVGYSFGNFEVNATQDFEIAPQPLVAETTPIKGNPAQLTVATYNVLNLSPLAEDDAKRRLLAEQITDNLRAPDVVALQEIQDNSGEADDGTVAADQTLQALVDAITAAGGPAYELFNVAPTDGASGGVPGGNIRNAFLYDPQRVELVEFMSLTPDVLSAAGASNPDAFEGTRNPLAATFAFNDRELTVINNHLTSRFGSTPIFGAIQPFVQAGEDAREAQVGALNDFVDSLLSADPDARVVVLGDLNTFEFTDDLLKILPGEDEVLTDLIDAPLNDDNVYTFNFRGNSQVLDHAFVTDRLVERARLDIVHVNVDFPRTADDVVASDHEPLVTRLRFPPGSDQR